MTFTDDDLKLLKKSISSIAAIVDGNHVSFDIKALIGRLEAAEKVCESCEFEAMEWSLDGDALKAWRKAAGK